MKTVYSLIIVLFLILLTGGCRKSYMQKEKQHILFQYEYINYAWGYVHEGFFVDDEGNVLYYRNPGNWNFHSQDYSITEKQIDENLSKCIRSEVKIDRVDLDKYSSFIDNISSSKITAKKSAGADAGTAVYICYTYNSQGGIYNGTLIKMEGDFTCENLNFYSKKVSMWLSEISGSISGK
jgi:hypothetical protein